MKYRFYIRCIAGLWLLLITLAVGNAQPALPDIAGVYKKGIVTLSWISQYDKPRSIAVKRSPGNDSGYIIIGEVKQLKKGYQFFTDPHPEPGKNYYKLLITFNSGLTWNTNYVEVTAGEKKQVKADAKVAIVPKPAPIIDTPKTEVKEIIRESPKTAIKDVINKVVKTLKQNVCSVPVILSKKDSIRPALMQKPWIYLTLLKEPPAIISIAAITDTHKHSPGIIGLPAKRLKFKGYDETSVEPELFIKYKNISIDPATGNVIIYLTEDVKVHHYSLKIYNKDDHLIWQVPYFNEPEIIMDKRNFQRSGVYKFVLRKDYLELEEVNIVIK